MSLTNCDKCQYLDRSPHHSGDIVCGLNPAYASMWKRLALLDDYSKNCLPINNCREFELNPLFEEKAIALNLSIDDWQRLVRDSSLPTGGQILDGVLFEHTLSLTLENWQLVANRTSIPNVRLALSNNGIEAQRDSWIHVDSSCIDAIAYIAAESCLKVRFVGNLVYQYFQVAESVFHDFSDAGSKGSFFNQYVKDCYRYSSID